MIHVYARVSSAKQIKGQSLTLQKDKEIAQQLALKYNTTVNPRDYIDEGKSAYSGKNLENELGRLLSDIDQDIIKSGDVVVVRTLDRLSRLSLMDAMEVYSKILKAGVLIYTTIDQQEHSGEEGKVLMSSILANLSFSLANEESRKKSYLTTKHALKRIDDHLAGVRTAGGYGFNVGVGGVPLHVKIVNKEITKHPDNFTVVQDLIKYALAGNGILKCQQWLNSKQKKQYSKQGVSNLLKSTALFGQLSVEVDGNDYQLHGFYPEACTEKEYYLLQSMRKNKNSSGNKKNHSLLSGNGILFCGDCKKSLAVNHANSKGGVYYTCINYKCPTSEKIFTVNMLTINAIYHLLYNFENKAQSENNLISLLEKQKTLSETQIKTQELILNNQELFGKTGKTKLVNLQTELEQLAIEIESEKKSSATSADFNKSDLQSIADEFHAEKEKILAGDSESNKNYAEIICKIVQDIVIHKDGLCEFTLKNGNKSYYYIPEQVKNQGRRIAVELFVFDADSKQMAEMKADDIFKMVAFSHDDIKNKKYVAELADFHESFHRLVSEPNTEFTAIDIFTNKLIGLVKEKGPLVYKKSIIMKAGGFTDKQWQNGRDVCLKRLDKLGMVKRIDGKTPKGFSTTQIIIYAI